MTTGWGFHDGTAAVYFGYFIISNFGFFLLKKVSILKIAGASILGSLTFFLITNFPFLSLALLDTGERRNSCPFLHFHQTSFLVLFLKFSNYSLFYFIYFSWKS